MSTDSAMLRRTAKIRAKSNMGRTPGSVMAILFVFLPTFLFSLFVLSISWEAKVTWPYEIATMVFDLLLTMPLLFGLLGFYLRISRGEKLSAVETLNCFWEPARYRTALRFSVASTVRSLLWSALPAFLMLKALEYAAPSVGIDPTTPVNASAIMLLVMLLCIPFEIKAATYQAGFNIMLDNAGMSAWQATKEGSALFRGRKMDLFVFIMSFLPWMFFVFISMGIGLLFVVPYALFSFLLYVEELRGNDISPAEESEKGK